MKSPVQPNPLLPMPRFANRLQDGERLLWEGKPDTCVFIRSSRKEAAWFVLPLVPLILLLEYGVCGGSLPWSSPVTWACSAMVWLICWLGFTAQVPAQARNAAYALTDRRLFIQRLEALTSQDRRPRVDEIPLQNVRLGLRLLGHEFGTITLGASWMAVYNTQRELRAIPNAEAVFMLLTEAQAALPLPGAAAQELSGPYYAQTKPLARLDAPWKLEDILRRGETILWQGAMDAAADWRSGLWAVPMFAVVMAAIGGAVLYELGVWTWTWQVLIFGVSLAIVTPVALSDARSSVGRPRYVLTNRRVLVIKNARKTHPMIEERELPETAKMRLVRGRDGFGTVIFEKKTRFVWQGQSGTVETYEFSFQHIADAEAVFGQIIAARQNYFAASAPQPSLPAA